MTESQDKLGLFHIVAIFGFDSKSQNRIHECVADCDGIAAIWCGGTDEELFRLKEWWLGALESVPLDKRLTLFIPPEEDFTYCADMLGTLADRFGVDRCKLLFCLCQPRGIAAKASQSLRLRVIKARAEKQGLAIANGA